MLSMANIFLDFFFNIFSHYASEGCHEFLYILEFVLYQMSPPALLTLTCTSLKILSQIYFIRH